MTGKNWEVGSTWYSSCNIDKEALSQDCDFSHITAEHITYLSTCRSAISLILEKEATGKRALVPSFTCHSVVAPFISNGCEVRSYPIKKNLEIDIEGFKSLVEEFKPDIILVHGYFGFNTLRSVQDYLDELKKEGVIIIEDVTQTMFSSFAHINASYHVGSIRKWLPIPDGAFLSKIKITNLVEDKEVVKAHIDAMQAKYEYIAHGRGKKEEIMPLFANAKAILNSRESVRAMSVHSHKYLSELSIGEFSKTRQSNYNRLAERLTRHSDIELILNECSKETVPFMLPVYICKNRMEFQKFMARHNVYPTIIWTCPEELAATLPDTSQAIYDEIICFYVDQRYDTTDMDKVADIIDSYYIHENEK